MLTILFNQGGPANAYNPTGGGGGASSGASHWYVGKHRGDLRKAIKSALKELSAKKTVRGRKRVARKVARDVLPMVELSTFGVIAALAPLEGLRADIADISRRIRAADDAAIARHFEALLRAYEAKAADMDRQEEESMVAILLLAMTEGD